MSLEEHRLLEAEYGVVREVEQTAFGGTQYGVEITVPGVCDKCAIKDNCYGKGSLVWADAPRPLRPGDAVCLEMKNGTVLAATAWVYGLPLVAVLLGTLLGHEVVFDGLSPEPRVLLSFGAGLALMGLVGIAMHRLRHWIAQRVRITAEPTGEPPRR
ncbi:MAG: SoxR reducing system RseC family protein [Spirochaetaceae bacterium]